MSSFTTNGAIIQDVYGVLKAFNTNTEKKRIRLSFSNHTQVKVTDDLSIISNLGYTQDITISDNYVARLSLFAPSKRIDEIERSNNKGTDGSRQFDYK
ncbi:hypothetical protein FHR24_003023 [Wenyingzhuangia heitensis]|uniref:Uncharacterized protein n=1 Tax=Wenyingzhuangia heitensis TaxID=1487859 RepID=A0ABX0UCH2_9FLAO|nr:hypothetical protein [Wenyingzhuangia heitensis]NIJ46534.1 hypothetical protein [Wenyingzhuangia heitensis]